MLKIIDPINEQLKDTKGKWTLDDYWYIMNLAKDIHDRLQQIKNR